MLMRLASGQENLFHRQVPAILLLILDYIMTSHNLSNIHKQAMSCERCGLHKTRKNVVFGDGAFDADIMFVGEAPGADEDDAALPFVGLTGKLLRSTIDAVGIDIPSIFITNTLMCRPEKNRDPTTEELSLCSPWLDSKIQLINPKIIVSVGRFSTAHFLSREPKDIKITQLCGKPIEIDNRIVIPLVHPSYVNRGGMSKFKYVEHMAMIAEAAQQMGLKGV